jgi:hypothetical protein
VQPLRSTRVLGAATWIFLFLTILAPLHMTQTTQAGGSLWCKTDPLVSLNGHLVLIATSIPSEYMAQVNGPIEIQIASPPDVDGAVLLNDLGFNGLGSMVTFVDEGVRTRDSIPIEIRVIVPMSLTQGEVAPVKVDVLAFSFASDSDVFTSVVGSNQVTTARFLIPTR